MFGGDDRNRMIPTITTPSVDGTLLASLHCRDVTAAAVVDIIPYFA